MQHWVALCANLLSLQERHNGKRFSWVTHADRGCGRYMSTEGTATAVLALGAGAVHVLEAGVAPLQMANNHYYLRVDEEQGSPVDQYVLSAVKGVKEESQPGFMTYGPYWQYPQGNYTADFFLRAPAPSGTMATVEVFDANRNQFLAQRTVQAAAFVGGNAWTRISLPITVTNPNNRLEFRTYWHGTANMDVAAIRIR